MIVNQKHIVPFLNNQSVEATVVARLHGEGDLIDNTVATTSISQRVEIGAIAGQYLVLPEESVAAANADGIEALWHGEHA